MNIFFNKINGVLQTKHCESKVDKVAKKHTIDNEVVKDLIAEIENAKDGKSAVEALLNAVEDGRLEECSGNCFKNGDYYILNLFKYDALPYTDNMKRISDLQLGIAPRQAAVIAKDDEYFIVNEIKGCKSGALIPFQEAKNKLLKEDLLAAYKDLQKVTKAGIADEFNLRSTEQWFVTPDDNRIVMPSWNRLRPLGNSDERNQTLERYYEMLFKN